MTPIRDVQPSKIDREDSDDVIVIRTGWGGLTAAWLAKARFTIFWLKRDSVSAGGYPSQKRRKTKKQAAWTPPVLCLFDPTREEFRLALA